MESNFLAELEMITSTSVWKKYIEQIKELRAKRLNALTSCTLERVQDYQGAIRAIDDILGLPGRMARKVEEKSQEE